MKPVLVICHVAHEGLGTIADALARNQVPYSIVDPLAGGAQAFDPRYLAGLVVMGGPMNVDEVEKYPALADEVRWIRQAVDANLPVLGVCLGAQLLAKALGSPVYANPVKEIGWYEIDFLTPALTDPLFDEVGPQTTVFQWHGDTFDLPAGARATGPQPAVRKSSVPLRRSRLWPTIPHGSNREYYRKLAVRIGQLRRTGRARLHRSRRHPPRNASETADDAIARRESFRSIRCPVFGERRLNALAHPRRLAGG